MKKSNCCVCTSFFIHHPKQWNRKVKVINEKGETLGYDWSGIALIRKKYCRKDCMVLIQHENYKEQKIVCDDAKCFCGYDLEPILECKHRLGAYNQLCPNPFNNYLCDQK